MVKLGSIEIDQRAAPDEMRTANLLARILWKQGGSYDNPDYIKKQFKNFLVLIKENKGYSLELYQAIQDCIQACRAESKNVQNSPSQVRAWNNLMGSLTQINFLADGPLELAQHEHRLAFFEEFSKALHDPKVQNQIAKDLDAWKPQKLALRRAREMEKVAHKSGMQTFAFQMTGILEIKDGLLKVLRQLTDAKFTKLLTPAENKKLKDIYDHTASAVQDWENKSRSKQTTPDPKQMPVILKDSIRMMNRFAKEYHREHAKVCEPIKGCFAGLRKWIASLFGKKYSPNPKFQKNMLEIDKILSQALSDFNEQAKKFEASQKTIQQKRLEIDKKFS